MSTDTRESSELEWTITFLYHVGPIGSLSINTDNLRCQSEEPVVDTTIVMAIIGSTPTDYGSQEIFTDDMLCGSMHLGEFSAMQRLFLVASSNTVTGGTYRLMRSTANLRNAFHLMHQEHR